MPNVVKGTISDSVRSAYLTQHRRRQFPESYFLLVRGNGERLFPWKDPKSGAIHCGLLRAAITRAAQHGYAQVENRARSLYERYCKTKKDFETLIETDFEILKKEEKERDYREVVGIVAEPDKPMGGEKNVEKDVFTKEAIKDMCFTYNENYYGMVKFRHGMPLTKEDVVVVGSYVVPDDGKLIIKGREIPEGTWIMHLLVKDKKLQKAIDDGYLKGLSLGGFILE